MKIEIIIKLLVDLCVIYRPSNANPDYKCSVRGTIIIIRLSALLILRLFLFFSCP